MANLVQCDNSECGMTVQAGPYQLTGWFTLGQIDPMDTMGAESDPKTFCCGTCVVAYLQTRKGVIV